MLVSVLIESAKCKNSNFYILWFIICILYTGKQVYPLSQTVNAQVDCRIIGSVLFAKI